MYIVYCAEKSCIPKIFISAVLNKSNSVKFYILFAIFSVQNAFGNGWQTAVYTNHPSNNI
jgi:hypothetical protein